MAALKGSTPAEAFTKFRDHLNLLLNNTVCDAPLIVITSKEHRNRAYVSFRQGGSPTAARLRSGGWYLYLGQNLEVVQEQDKRWRLRTLAYSYRIQRGPGENDPWVFRFEYISRELQSFPHPRHHLHLPATLHVPGTIREIDLAKVHVPTGWVTVEELVRFLIHGLKVKSRKTNWDKLCRESEEKFREWTGRSI